MKGMGKSHTLYFCHIGSKNPCNWGWRERVTRLTTVPKRPRYPVPEPRGPGWARRPPRVPDEAPDTELKGGKSCCGRSS
jgi:hypothetical protein